MGKQEALKRFTTDLTEKARKGEVYNHPPLGYVKGRHARFGRAQEGDVVEDLHSTNGTYVNGDRLVGVRRLAAGDVVTIGQTQLTYRGGT